MIHYQAPRVHPDQPCEVLVIGGGIAGLSAAFHLSQRGWRGVQLLEREPALATHSSGRNAAIFRQLGEDAIGVALALRSASILDASPGDLGLWLQRSGALYVAADAAVIDRAVAQAVATGVAHERVDGEELVRRAPVLRAGSARCGLWVPGDGVIDIHAVTESLARAVRAAGVRVRTSCGVQRILASNGRVRGVLLDDGSELTAARVVNAAGAWSAGLGAAVGAPLALVPLRRHLAVLDAEIAPAAPVVWNLDDEIYFRPESGGLLASPCDETRWEPCVPPTSIDALELLGAKLASLAPRLAECGVRRSWACLRTFALDRQFVAGQDPRLDGLYWLGGFGGRGMTEGLAAGEVLAAVMNGETPALAAALSPARLLKSTS